MKKFFRSQKIKLSELMNSFRGKVMAMVIAAFLAALIMFLIVTIAISNIYSKAMDSQNDALETESIMSITDNLYTHVSDYAILNLDDSLSQFRLQMTEHIDYFEKKRSESPEYKENYRDLYELALHFEELAEGIIADHDNGVPTAIIRSRMGNLQNAGEFLDNELLTLMKLQVQDSQQEMEQIHMSLENYHILCIIIAVFGCTVIVFFANRFTQAALKSLNDLNSYTVSIQEGNYEPFEPQGKVPTEINNLITAYNELSGSVKCVLETAEENVALTNQLKEEAINNLKLGNLLQEAELKFLRSQINPHFLFNTLNAIIAMAVDEDAPGVEDMLMHLTFILRAAMGSNRFISLKDEITLVNHYLEIQNIRFGDRLKIEKYIDPSVGNIMVPALILQPFIENAILHGIEPMENGGILGFFAFRHGDDVVVHIRDNGAGMPEDKLDEFKNFANADSTVSQHGAGNVMRRLQIIYQKNVVDIASAPGGGTDIRITLPGGNSNKMHIESLNG